MNPEKALVDNAADEEQVQKATKQVRFNRQDEIQDMRDLLDTAYGRRIMWRLISGCHVFQSISQETDRIHYYSGKQDVGHDWMNEIIEADPVALTDMMRLHHKKLARKQ